MNIQIIGAIFGRTGTLSLQQALEELGFGPCLHMSDFAADTERCRAWLEELLAEWINWPRLLSGFASAVGWPVCIFLEEILEWAPEARVIVTERDFDSWYRSVSDTVFPALRWAELIPEKARPEFVQLAREVIGNRTFAEEFDRESVYRLYRVHLENIVEKVPADRLLHFSVSDGWGPLCGFLGRPVPDRPFPRENPSGEFFSLLSRMRRKRRVER